MTEKFGYFAVICWNSGKFYETFPDSYQKTMKFVHTLVQEKKIRYALIRNKGAYGENLIYVTRDGKELDSKF